MVDSIDLVSGSSPNGGPKRRILLFTGKGGVGKTTMAAATALRCAALGYRTVVVSTDAAHSLADSFDRTLGPEPILLADNLWGQELDVLHQMDKYWGNVQRYVSAVLAWRGLDDVVADELSVFPGMEELASLIQIVALHDQGDYDVIIIDSAPTGETLRLLAMPDTMSWYMERVFPIERRLLQLSRPLLRTVTDAPIPEDQVLDAIQDLMGQLRRMRALLADAALSSVRLVLNPEKMVIKEAQRTFTYLNLYGYATDAVISNRVIPDEVQDRYFDAWKEAQAAYGRTIEEAFSPLPILQVPLLDQEVVGEEMLRRVAQAIYGDDDPTRVYYVGWAYEVGKQDGHYVMKIHLPFISKADVELTHSRDELIVQIGNRRRNIFLPRSLAELDVLGAKYEADVLAVRFGRQAEGVVEGSAG